MLVAAAPKSRTPAMPMRSPTMNNTAPATYRAWGTKVVVRLGTRASRTAASAREPMKITGGRAMTPAVPREAPLSDAAPSDEVTTGTSARIRRIANRSPSTATLIARISTGSRNHMIDSYLPCGGYRSKLDLGEAELRLGSAVDCLQSLSGPV